MAKVQAGSKKFWLEFCEQYYESNKRNSTLPDHATYRALYQTLKSARGAANEQAAITALVSQLTVSYPGSILATNDFTPLYTGFHSQIAAWNAAHPGERQFDDSKPSEVLAFIQMHGGEFEFESGTPIMDAIVAYKASTIATEAQARESHAQGLEARRKSLTDTLTTLTTQLGAHPERMQGYAAYQAYVSREIANIDAILAHASDNTSTHFVTEAQGNATTYTDVQSDLFRTQGEAKATGKDKGRITSVVTSMIFAQYPSLADDAARANFKTAVTATLATSFPDVDVSAVYDEAFKFVQGTNQNILHYKLTSLTNEIKLLPADRTTIAAGTSYTSIQARALGAFPDPVDGSGNPIALDPWQQEQLDFQRLVYMKESLKFSEKPEDKEALILINEQIEAKLDEMAAVGATTDIKFLNMKAVGKLVEDKTFDDLIAANPDPAFQALPRDQQIDQIINDKIASISPAPSRDQAIEILIGEGTASDLYVKNYQVAGTNVVAFGDYGLSEITNQIAATRSSEFDKLEEKYFGMAPCGPDGATSKTEYKALLARIAYNSTPRGLADYYLDKAALRAKWDPQRTVENYNRQEGGEAKQNGQVVYNLNFGPGCNIQGLLLGSHIEGPVNIGAQVIGDNNRVMNAQGNGGNVNFSGQQFNGNNNQGNNVQDNSGNVTQNINSGNTTVKEDPGPGPGPGPDPKPRRKWTPQEEAVRQKMIELYAVQDNMARAAMEGQLDPATMQSYMEKVEALKTDILKGGIKLDPANFKALSMSAQGSYSNRKEHRQQGQYQLGAANRINLTFNTDGQICLKQGIEEDTLQAGGLQVKMDLSEHAIEHDATIPQQAELANGKAETVVPDTVPDASTMRDKVKGIAHDAFETSKQEIIEHAEHVATGS